MKKVFNFECYFCDPVTGTTGWDIKMISVVAETKPEARNILKTIPHFDCVILHNRTFNPDESDLSMIHKGLTYWETADNFAPIG